MRDLEFITTEYQRMIARLAPKHRALAQRTFHRVPPARWQLEWYLPHWLGDAFGLEQQIAREFVLSNVLGLASIRLRDDLQDGEIELSARKDAIELAAFLQDAALEIYQPYLARADSFWEYVDASLRAWQSATQRVNSFSLHKLTALRDLTTPSARFLVSLGAPLKISAFAVCHLTEHRRDLNVLSILLDHLLLANLLYDHAMDCDADLRAGRWNLFVATVSKSPQNAANQLEHRARVAQAWMTSNFPRAYFKQIEYHIAQAQQLNRALRVAGFDTFTAQFNTNVWQTHAYLKQYYAAQLELVTRKLFGASKTNHPRRHYGISRPNPKTHLESHL